jgi:hypothetical protein
MKFSEFLRRKILQMAGGVILNYFKIKKRRDTLYFGEIPAKYFLLCEKKGFGAELQEIGQKWMYLYFSTLIPEAFKKIPPEDLLNGIVKRIWINMGVMGDFSIKREGNILRIETRDEGMTELIGKNSFLLGFHEGVINALYGKEVEILDVKQTKGRCRYRFKIRSKKFKISGKIKEEYDRLNYIPEVRGPTLDDMLKRKLFRLKGHKIYFRGKTIYPIENTVIHLFSNRGLILESVPKISYEFFNGILDKKSTKEDKLRLLKNLMQVMGWGIFSISKRKNSLKIKIENPPYGLQGEKENWDFLAKMIEGYVKNIDKKYRIDRINEGYKLLNIGFSK